MVRRGKLRAHENDEATKTFSHSPGVISHLVAKDLNHQVAAAYELERPHGLISPLCVWACVQEMQNHADNTENTMTKYAPYHPPPGAAHGNLPSTGQCQITREKTPKS
jgi:hypothetical protein